MTLFALRHLFPGVPLAVVGQTMIRRCLSIVAPDLLSTSDKPKSKLCATHIVMNPTKFANTADVVQQFLRPATTFVHQPVSRKPRLDDVA